MIINQDINGYDSELQKLLAKSAKVISNKSESDRNLMKLSGTAFEKVVCDQLNEVSKDTSFYNKFEQASKYSFPDLYAKVIENKWFGIEVKTSKSDWKCFGNSIFESTRIDNLDDRIYVFFGKLTNPLECRWSRYADCIDNINITHSPRYQINMDIGNSPELSIFSKMKVSYNDFYNIETEKKMAYLRKFKKQSLGENAALWWLPENDQSIDNAEKKLVIKLFSDLPSQDRELIRHTALALFPEVLSNKASKYQRLPTWMASQYGVVMGNIRDLFTAGGKWNTVYSRNSYSLPKICLHISNGTQDIKDVLREIDNPELEKYWQLNEIDIPFEGPELSYEQRLNIWIEIAAIHLKTQNGMPNNFPIEDWLNSIFR